MSKSVKRGTAGMVSLNPPKRMRESVDYSRCVICQKSSEVELMNIQTASLPKFLDAMNARQDKTYSVLKDKVRNEFSRHRNSRRHPASQRTAGSCLYKEG
ncbi:hypothetical protein Pcinc_033654 [Petrolisthes cinctipes]|uniref:Uncharacterized protein n=1 Tax=Petrolisthes cinctipes TaxID=88211 RepID=A0AAE1ERV5_PETCI|nr:hypothetical protein Pcinc_033654 [Petrolisthes cinctipes]